MWNPPRPLVTGLGVSVCLLGSGCFADAGSGDSTGEATSGSESSTSTDSTSSTTGSTGPTTAGTGTTSSGTTGTATDSAGSTGGASAGTGSTGGASAGTGSTGGVTAGTGSTGGVTAGTGSGSTGGTTGGAGCPVGAPDLLNGDFATTDEWTVSAGAEIAAGMLSMSGIDVCDGGGAVQTVCVPPFEDLFGPYALRVDATIGACGNCEYTAVAFRSGPTGGPLVRVHVPYAQSGTHSFCLGEAAYDGDVDLFVGGMVPNGCSMFAKTLDLDNVVLEPADPVECPEPGKVLNGDMQLGNAGWKITTASNGASVTWQGAADLEMLMDLPGGVCSTARVTGQVSVPLTTTVPNAAVKFSAKADGAFNLRVMNGDVGAYQSFNGTNAAKDYFWCLPPALAGGVFTAQLEISNAGSCAGMPARQLLADDFTIVSDAANCP